ncbi:OmpA family protein [Psychromonas sp. KJ10-10]|uniref:OmpA family protein n=1 Tax=Psychromonas sp. KJ10-10 TaxID=3391823 RepID=UPI0039B62999
MQLQGTCVPNQVDNKANVEPVKVQSKQAPLSKINEQIIHDLLNNNNQFVRDSAPLNPRYIGQLAEVAQLLRDHPEYQLKITGHADTTGDASNNLSLSLQRAQQVERYLQIFGLSPNNIVIAGEGDSNPLFDGEQAQVQLVNRRVSIELINTTTQKAD